MAAPKDIRYLNPPTAEAKKKNTAASKKAVSSILITKTLISY